MTQEQIIAKALELVKAGKPFMLATVDEQTRPQMRWMGLAVVDEAQPRVCYMASSATARKMQQIAQNPQAQIILSREDFSSIATIGGTAQAENSIEWKQRLWEQAPILSNYYKGPDDPNFGLIKFTADRIEMINMSNMEEMGVVEF